MHDYHWLDFADRPLPQRFPPWDWIAGVEAWAEGAERFPFGLPPHRDPLDPNFNGVLGLPPAAAKWVKDIREAPRKTDSQPCPRVFVSHRQVDDKEARRIAWIAGREGFDYWLDVIDLDPQRNLQVQMLQGQLGRPLTALEASILTAAIIEMALLNCGYVLAAMTANTAGSQWVPYEYGRIKDVGPFGLHAACWWDTTTLPRGALPEYLYLGGILRNEHGVAAWFRQHLVSHPSCPGSSRAVSVGAAEPPPLRTG